jgi:hypothetical protein
MGQVKGYRRRGKSGKTHFVRSYTSKRGPKLTRAGAAKHIASRNRLTRRVASMPVGGFMSDAKQTGPERIRLEREAAKVYHVWTADNARHFQTSSPRKAARKLYRWKRKSY